VSQDEVGELSRVRVHAWRSYCTTREGPHQNLESLCKRLPHVCSGLHHSAQKSGHGGGTPRAYAGNMTPRGWIAFLTSLSLATSGCTLVGAGVGAAVDAAIPGPYDTRPPEQHVRFAPRQRIMVWRANGARVAGRYLGAVGPTAKDPETYLIIDAGERPAVIPVSDVKALGVERSADGWVYGSLIGLAIDVTLVVAAVIAVNNTDFSRGWATSSSNCWC
jgi:hypothetical protein